MSEQNPPQSISGIFPVITCQHQFFEIRDISFSPMGTMTLHGKEQMVMHPWKGGKMVMCAVCGTRRQLWDTGELLEWIEDKWEPIKHE